MPSSRYIGRLLFSMFFHIQGAFGQSGGKAGEGIIKHMEVDSSHSRSDGPRLPPDPSAVFAIAVVVAVIAGVQLQLSLRRFKRPPLPPGESTLPYDIGILFRVFLTSYIMTFIANSALYAAKADSLGGIITLPPTFEIGVALTDQLSLILFYSTFLTIVAYRQRIQLNPQEHLFNLKSLLDSLLLTTILFLGVAVDTIYGISSASAEGKTAIQDIDVALQVVGLLVSLDVAISSYIARSRLSSAGIQDKIINICALVVSPAVITGGIYGVIEAIIERNADPATFNFNALLIATVAVKGVISTTAVTCGLVMGLRPEELMQKRRREHKRHQTPK